MGWACGEAGSLVQGNEGTGQAEEQQGEQRGGQQGG